MRPIAYIRVSTVLQASEGVSLEAQRARVEAWAALHGAVLDEADVHVDAGLSGKDASNRPALQAALDSVCACRGVLVVYSLSRLARSVRDTIAIGERLSRAGADLVSLSESIDTTTATGKMLFRLLAVLAEFERDLLVERTEAAIAHKRAKGERIGQVPYGKRLADDGRTLVPHEGEAQALGYIRSWRAEGRSLRQIAGSLTLIGIPTKNGGLTWRHSTVSELLKRAPLHDDREAEATESAGPEAQRPDLATA
jgi:site-specific DNA recombinase